MGKMGYRTSDLSTENPLLHGRGFFCRVLYMAFFNFLLAAIIGALAYGKWSDPYLSVIIGWFAFRVETLISIQLQHANMTHALLKADTARMEMVVAAHEQNVAEIASNN